MAHKQPGMTLKKIRTLFGFEVKSLSLKPLVHFTITIKYVDEICKELFYILQHAYKVQMSSEDRTTLTNVIRLQIEVKVWYSTRGTEFAIVNSKLEERVEKVKCVLSVTISPLSCYLDQIGRVEFDSQILVPKIIEYNNDVVQGIVGVPMIGGPLDASRFNDLVNNYNSLIGRIQSKVQNALVSINYEANGTPAQLVTSKLVCKTYQCCWSCRNIDAEYLHIGCIFRFGYGLENYDDSHRFNFRVCETFVDTTGQLHQFLRRCLRTHTND